MIADVRFLRPQAFMADLDEPVSVLLGNCLSIGQLSRECADGGLVLASGHVHPTQLDSTLRLGGVRHIKVLGQLCHQLA